jgi:hypothetical protein
MPGTNLLPERKIETADPPKMLNEAVWNASLDRSAEKDRRKHAFRMEVMRCIRIPLCRYKACPVRADSKRNHFRLGASSSRWYALAFLIVAIAFNPFFPSSWLSRNSPVLLVARCLSSWERTGASQTEATVSSTKAFHAE